MECIRCSQCSLEVGRRQLASQTNFPLVATQLWFPLQLFQTPWTKLKIQWSEVQAEEVKPRYDGKKLSKVKRT